ncbi:MAG: helix-turn-helix transcriptional regulator [Myxococcota bacterium]
MTPAEAYDAAWFGRFAHRAPVPAHPLGWALRAQRYFAGLEPEMPPRSELQGIGGDAEILGWALQGRFAHLRFDGPGLCEAAEASAAIPPATPRAALWSEALRLWVAVHAGQDETHPAFESFVARAASARLAPLVIEAGVLRAEASLNGSDLERATELARRVSRMARTEGLPQQEYLAHLTLARLRRRSGYSHLAGRIVAGLLRAAPPAWTPALTWEAALTGGQPHEPDDGPAGCLAALFTAAVKGSPEAFAHASARLEDATRGQQRLREEALVLALATTPLAPTSQHRQDEVAAAVAETLAPWTRGETSQLPFGLGGAVHQRSNPHLVLPGHTWVHARPDAPARRFLHPGVGLVRSEPRIERGRQRHGRIETATAVLALAGPSGLALRKFIPEVYGFGYSRKAHDGVLRVLLHRMREALGPVADVERTDDQLTLHVRSSFLVPDPRTAPRAGDRVLRMVATQPGATAREVSQALGLSLRAVQNELRELLDAGVCLAEKKGSRVQYGVEDTTFSEPTDVHRL